MARLVKTASEFEGNYFEQWILVDDEDEALPRWGADAELHVVGRPTPRADGAVRVTGAARYTVDIVLPGLLHAALLVSPIAHGRVRNLDLEAARRSPGVRAVIGPDDAIGEGAALLTAEPQFAGAAIAAVVADSAEEAEAALAAFALDLEPLPFVVDLDQALNDQRFTEDPIDETRGDPEAAMAAADVRVEVTIETPAQIHSALETHATVVDWRTDELTVWLSTQSMFAARDSIASRFGLPTGRVRVITEFVGGAFGGKLGSGTEPMLAAELSRRSGRPVRLVNPRHLEQLTGGHRAATRQTVRLGARRDGTLVAVDADAVLAMGTSGFVPGIRSGPMVVYRSENAQALTFPVRLNLQPLTAFRAPGVLEATTVLEQAVDELAKALDLDPLELRRRNHVDVDQRTGKPYSSKRLLDCYDRAAELSGWAERDRLREPAPDGLLRGMGCATQFWWGGGLAGAQATVRLGSDGVATVVTGIQDLGTGTLTVARMVAAEELGLPLEQVRVTGGDTKPNVYGPHSGGSGTLAGSAPAVRAASAKVRRKLLELAAGVLEIPVFELEIEGGRIRTRDRGVDRPYTDVTERLGVSTLEGSGMRGPNPDSHLVNTFGCQIAQVAVDPGLGTVVVEKIWAVHDVGRILNPLGASSQVEGAVLQSVGYAISEERIVDPTIGTPVNATFDDYKVPTIADAPEIIVDFVEVPDPIATSVGSRGLGEPPAIPTAAAIANAFAHATGRRAKALPLTPARVLETLA
jgi:CO/xanthine dehydrogenase Mo-binding subunit